MKNLNSFKWVDQQKTGVRIKSIMLLAVTVNMLSACSFLAGQDDLDEWMREKRQSVKPSVKPIQEPKQFQPESYVQSALVDPFNQDKLVKVLTQDITNSATYRALVAPELARRKEVLESYPIDAIQMVGYIKKQAKPVALVLVDKVLYQVGIGNYVGQNYGKIVAITENETVVREIVQDNDGEWIERKMNLQLQEKAQK